MQPEEVLQATVQRNNDLVVSIDLIDTIERAYQEAIKKWKEKIIELQNEINTLRATITKMNDTVAETNKLLGDQIGADGKGGAKLKAHVAGWKEVQFPGSGDPPTPPPSDPGTITKFGRSKGPR